MSTDHTGISPVIEYASEDVASHESQLNQALSLAAAGDRAALAQVFDLTASSVYGLAVRMLSDPAEAEEGAREAYLRIWQALPALDQTRAPGAGWVMATAHAHLVDRRRRRNCDGTVIADSSTTRNRADTALAELPAVQREALTLAYFEGRTHTEVADLTGAPPEAAARRIHAGLTGLRGLAGT